MSRLASQSKPLKILYAAGPGNVIETYHYWKTGKDDPRETSITYSGQFYTVCRELNAQAYVIAYNSDKQIIQDEQFTLEHRPIPFRNSSSILYHLGMLWYGIGLLISAIRFQTDVAVISDGTIHWFILSVFTLFGIKVIPSLHCVLFLKYIPPTKLQQLILRLSRRLFAKDCTAILVVSDEIGEQVKQLTNEQNQPIFRSFAIYREKQFEQITEPNLSNFPIKVLYIGRIESNKGIFILPEVAKQLVAQSQTNIKFDICGDGSALTELQVAVEKAKLTNFLVCHGHCNKNKIREMLNQCHIIIVPTQTNFGEGFNKVIVEGILAHRPVIASKVCNDLSLLNKAVISVEPDDIQGYTQAIIQLINDSQLYQEKQKATYVLQEQFYDLSKGWGTQLKSILVAIQNLGEIKPELNR